MLVQNGREEAESAHGGCLSRVAPSSGAPTRSDPDDPERT